MMRALLVVATLVFACLTGAAFTVPASSQHEARVLSFLSDAASDSSDYRDVALAHAQLRFVQARTVPGQYRNRVVYSTYQVDIPSLTVEALSTRVEAPGAKWTCVGAFTVVRCRARMSVQQ